MKVLKALDNQNPTDGEALFFPHPFCTYVVAPIGAGKTTMTINVLRKFYKGFFHRLVFISSTAHLDDKLKLLFEDKELLSSNQALQDAMSDDCELIETERVVLPKYHSVAKEDIHTRYSKDILVKLKEEQKLVKKRFGDKLCDRVLLICDDSIATGIYKSGGQAFAEFVSILRHLNVSIWHISQHWKEAPRKVRLQSTGAVLFELPKTVIKEVCEELRIGIDPHHFEEIYNVVTNEKYKCVVVICTNKKGLRLVDSFEQIIYT